MCVCVCVPPSAVLLSCLACQTDLNEVFTLFWLLKRSLAVIGGLEPSRSVLRKRFYLIMLYTPYLYLCTFMHQFVFCGLYEFSVYWDQNDNALALFHIASCI